MKYKKQAIIFASALLTFGIIAWSGGYDFNERSPFVALGVGVSLWLSGVAAVALGGVK